MAKIKDLQKLIEERAEKKLESDLKDLQKLFHEQPLLQNNGIEYPPLIAVCKADPSLTSSYEKTKIGSLLNSHPYVDFKETDNYIGQLYRFWLPTYIERESAEFLQTVDRVNKDLTDLQDEVINLMNNQSSE